MMRSKILLTVLVTGFVACNDAADTTADTNDSLARDSINRMDNTRNDMEDTLKMRRDDATWVSDVLENNYAEMELAKQAQQKTTNAEIKSLAAMLEKDHMALINEAKNLAGKKNWTVATGETSEATRDRQDMMDDDVNDYQKAWLEKMEDSHEKSIKKFEDGRDDVSDADLRAWINTTLPKLQAHHDRIKQVQKNVI